MLPEIIYSFFNGYFPICWLPEKLAAVYILALILTLTPYGKNETYFYYISDHGEALGQDGLWGHGHLNPADLRVPFLFTMFNSSDKNYQKKVKDLESLCAYQIALLIAEKLGFDIKIPNKNNNICLINGRDSIGRAGILQINKQSDGTYHSEKRI